jgi:hypothetical protein
VIIIVISCELTCDLVDEKKSNNGNNGALAVNNGMTPLLY